MTTVASILSTKALASADIMDVAGECILMTGEMIAALRSANMPHDHEIMGMLAALQRRFINITSGDGDTSYVPEVAYSPDTVAVPTTYAPDVSSKKTDAPLTVKANDITEARERIVAHIRKEIRVKRKDAITFLGRTDATDILDTLVTEKRLTYTKHGRTAGYGIATVPAGWDAVETSVPSEPVAVAEIPAGWGDDAVTTTPISSQENPPADPPATPKRKPGRPRKEKVTPTTIETVQPPATSADPVKVAEAQPDTRTLANWTNEDLLAEIERRLDAKVMSAVNHEQADKRLKELRAILS